MTSATPTLRRCPCCGHALEPTSSSAGGACARCDGSATSLADERTPLRRGRRGWLADFASGLALVGRAGVTLYRVGSVKESVSINALMLPLLEKRLLGCWYGSANVHVEVPRLLALYRRGKLKLDELVTRTYPLSSVNEAFADMSSGANARGVVTF